MPEAKNALAFSSLRFSNGSTAIDFSDIAGDVTGAKAGIVAVALTSAAVGRKRWNVSNPAASGVSASVIPTSLRPVALAIDSLGKTSAVR